MAITITVDNLEEANKKLLKQNAKLIGSIEEIPGHVKLQMIRDNEGNYFQLVEHASERNDSHHIHDCCCH